MNSFYRVGIITSLALAQIPTVEDSGTSRAGDRVIRKSDVGSGSRWVFGLLGRGHRARRKRHFHTATLSDRVLKDIGVLRSSIQVAEQSGGQDPIPRIGPFNS